MLPTKHDSYWCVYCGRQIIGEPVYNEDGEITGYVFVHDEIEHPVEATYNEEKNPQ